jgi:phosphoglycolate phosphatase
MIELVIFDADGVLFESGESNIAYYNAIFAATGEPPLTPAEEIASRSYATAQLFRERAGERPALYQRMLELARTLDNRPFLKMLRPSLQLRPFMLALKNRYRVALATNRSATVPALIEHLELGGVFDAIASARDKVKPKPAPDILQLCLERADVPAHRAIYVGDSPIDLDASTAAGMHFIGLGPHVTHEHRVASLTELPARLDALRSVLSQNSNSR